MSRNRRVRHAKPATSLSQKDAQQLKLCEHTIEGNSGEFFKIGGALLTIREGELYRVTHATFEAYCEKRWSMGRSYVWRLIGAAERLRLLNPEPNLPMPRNEAQMRPFLKLTPQSFPSAWKQIVAKAKSRKITSQTIQVLVDKTLLGRSKHSNSSRHWKRKRVPGNFTRAEICMLIGEARQRALNNDSASVIAALDRLEMLFLGL